MITSQKALRAELLAGRQLLCTKDAGFSAWSLDTGKAVEARVVERMLALDLVEGVGDGLFGDSQSYRLKPQPEAVQPKSEEAA